MHAAIVTFDLLARAWVVTRTQESCGFHYCSSSGCERRYLSSVSTFANSVTDTRRAAVTKVTRPERGDRGLLRGILLVLQTRDVFDQNLLALHLQKAFGL